MKKKLLWLLIIVIGLLSLLIIYGRFFETNYLVTNEINLSENVSDSYDGLKIVHFSDLHYIANKSNQQLKKLIKEINLIKPDIIIFTGDLANSKYNLTYDDTNYLIKEFKNVSSKYGNYATLGETDENNIENVKYFFEQSNFTLLDNSYDIIYNEQKEKIIIGGLNYKSPDYEKIMNIEENVNLKIILTHYPNSIDNILNKYNDISLILSGHNLGGKINIPFIKDLFITDESRKYDQNHYKINNTNIYISNGLGNDNLNFRLFNYPSINFFRINKKNA